MHVSSILTNKGASVATIAPTATLEEAAAALRDHGVGALVVSSDETSVDGIISERDVVRALAAFGSSTLRRRVEEVMSRDVYTCAPADSCEQLMAMMTERRIRHLPVLDGGRLSGIVSIGDVVKNRVGLLEQENSQLHDYIQGLVWRA